MSLVFISATQFLVLTKKYSIYILVTTKKPTIYLHKFNTVLYLKGKLKKNWNLSNRLTYLLIHLVDDVTFGFNFE